MCFCPDDGDLQEFASTSYPKAAKAYRCYECRSDIRVGERHAKYVSKWDGRVSMHRWCLACDAWIAPLMHAMEIVCGCSGYTLGQLDEAVLEFMIEHLGYDPRTGNETGDLDLKLVNFELPKRAA